MKVPLRNSATAWCSSRVDYELTKLGRSLLEPVSGLDAWARRNRIAIAQARARFDAAAGRG
jgi:DNA-binding HxlR family transcriptional regulator